MEGGKEASEVFPSLLTHQVVDQVVFFVCVCVMVDVVRVVTTDPSDFWTLLGWKTATFGCSAGFTELCDVVQPGGGWWWWGRWR